MTVGAARKITRVKSVHGNLYDNWPRCICSQHEFFLSRVGDASSRRPAFLPLRHSPPTFAPVYNSRNIFPYNYSFFFFDHVSFQEKCVSHLKFSPCEFSSAYSLSMSLVWSWSACDFVMVSVRDISLRRLFQNYRTSRHPRNLRLSERYSFNRNSSARTEISSTYRSLSLFFYNAISFVFLLLLFVSHTVAPKKNRCVGRKKFAVLTIDGQARLLTAIHSIRLASPTVYHSRCPSAFEASFFPANLHPFGPTPVCYRCILLWTPGRMAFEGINGPPALDIPK